MSYSGQLVKNEPIFKLIMSIMDNFERIFRSGYNVFDYVYVISGCDNGKSFAVTRQKWKTTLTRLKQSTNQMHGLGFYLFLVKSSVSFFFENKETKTHKHNQTQCNRFDYKCFKRKPLEPSPDDVYRST